MNLTPDERERQIREFEAAWHQFVGPAKRALEPQINAWFKETFPDKQVAYRFEVNYDDSTEKEACLKSLQEILDQGGIEFKFFLPHIRFETYAEALDYARTGKLKEPKKEDR